MFRVGMNNNNIQLMVEIEEQKVNPLSQMMRRGAAIGAAVGMTATHAILVNEIAANILNERPETNLLTYDPNNHYYSIVSAIIQAGGLTTAAGFVGALVGGVVGAVLVLAE